MIKAGLFMKNAEVYKSKNFINNPVISVIMPTYCRGNNGLLKRSIESVLGQEFSDFELIIVDDGSVDRTRDVVNEFMKCDNRVLYIRNNINSGLPALRVNQGMKYSRGKYIAYQFDDDQWYPNALKDLYQVISRHDEPMLVYGKSRFVDLLSNNEAVLGDEFNYNLLRSLNYIGNNTVLHSRELPFLYGGYDCHVAMKRLCDWDLWVRWSDKVKFQHVDAVVSRVEVNQENSLGQTVIWDKAIVRYLQSLNRNELLRLDVIEEYVVDDLDIVNKDALQNMVFQEHVLPWYGQRIDVIKNHCVRPSRKKENIVVIIHGYSATINILIANFKELLADKYNVMFESIYHLDHRLVEYADVIILVRLGSSVPIISNLMMKKPTVYAADDNVLKLYTLKQKEFEIFAPGTEAYETIKNYIQSCDLLYCTTKGISDEFVKYNRSIIEIPVNIQSAKLNQSFSPIDNKLKIAWIGWSSRVSELEFFKNDVQLIASELKDDVEFYFVGAKTPNDPIPNCIYLPEIQSYEEYLKEMKKHSFHIVVSVIEETEFKNGKSAIKFLEATAFGAVGIFSNDQVYWMVKDNFNGFKIPYERGALYKKVLEIVRNHNADSLRNIWENARKEVLSRHTTEANLSKFEEMIERAKFNFFTRTSRNLAFVTDRKGLETLSRYIKLLERLNISNVYIYATEPFINHETNLQVHRVIQNVDNVGLYLKEDGIDIVHDLTNHPLIQWHSSQASVAYVQEKALQTYNAIYDISEERYCSVLLKFYNNQLSLLREGRVYVEKTVNNTHENNSRDHRKLLNLSLAPPSQPVFKKVAKENNEFYFTCTSDCLAGLRLPIEIEGKNEGSVTLEIRSINKKNVLLRKVSFPLIEKNDHIQEIMFEQPLTGVKNSTLFVLVKPDRPNDRVMVHCTKNNHLVGEAIYKLENEVSL